MLGRALAVEAGVQENETFRPVESAFVSSGRIAYAQSEPAVEVSGLADTAYDLQDELARLGRFGIDGGAVAGVLGDAIVRSLGRQLWKQRCSVL